MGMESGSSGMAQEFWHLIRKALGVSQESQDRDLESIRATNKSVLVVGRHIKQPDRDREQRAIRESMAKTIKIQHLDKFIFGDKKTGKGKGSQKVQIDGDTQVLIALYGIRSPSIISSEEQASKEIK